MKKFGIRYFSTFDSQKGEDITLVGPWKYRDGRALHAEYGLTEYGGLSMN